jgi:hypothetical protein
MRSQSHQNVVLIKGVKLRQWLGFLGYGQLSVGKLRTVLPISDVIRDSAVQLVLTHQRGAVGVESSTCESGGYAEG